MKIERKVFLLFLITLCSAFTCNKDSEKEAMFSAQELIGRWQMIGRDITTTEGGPVLDNFSGESDCFKDNIYEFQAGGNSIIDDNLLKCDPDGPQQENWPYSLDANSKQFTWSLYDVPQVYDVLELSSTRFRIRSQPLPTGNRVVITFKKI